MNGLQSGGVRSRDWPKKAWSQVVEKKIVMLNNYARKILWTVGNGES